MQMIRNKRNTMMKIVTGVAAFAMSFMLCGVGAFAYTNTWGEVKGGGANIRAQATTQSDIVASVAGNTQIEICGSVKADDGYTWYKVHVNGTKDGYIRGDLVTDTGNPTGAVSADEQAGTQEAGEDETVEETPVEEIPQEVDTSLSDATIHTLSISEGTIQPEFQPSITDYTIYVGEETTAISVFGAPNPDSGATVIDNSGFSDLQLGANAGVITIQAFDGTTMTYHFNVIRGDVVETPEETGSGNVTYTVQTGNDHTGIVIFLVILVLLMGIAIVLLVLANLNMRRMLENGGRGYRRGFGLPDFAGIFQNIKAKFSGGGSENQTVYKKRKEVSMRPLKERRRIDRMDDGEYEPEEDFDGSYTNASSNGSYMDNQPSYSSAGGSGIQDPGMSYASVEEALNSIKDVTAPTEYPAELYRENLAVDAPVDEAADLPQGEVESPEEMYDLEDEDELEDILERNATITDNSGNKEVWKPENFLTPRDDLEFEFLDIDDDDEDGMKG